MKLWLLALLLLGVLLSAACAEEQRPRQRREVKSFQEADQADEDDEDEEDSEEVEEEEEEEEYSEEEVDVAKEEQKEKEKEDERKNPCLEKTCRRGEICSVDKRQRARCVCIPQCRDPDDTDDRYQVCSRRNVTYQSECELDRDHCLCRRQLEGCSTPNTGKIRLDYYGHCQELTPCNEREFNLFPARMREWLYVVMQQLAQRAKIPEYLELLEEARHEANHSHAVIWKFCDLDVDPHDRFVSRRELLFTIQSLKALEHCLLPFLDHCDTDSDSRITLWEWGRCLGLEEGKIKDECKAVRKAAGREEK